MALKLTVLKNHLPTCSSPFIVRSGSSEVVDFDRLVDIMSKGRTTLSKIDILAAMQLFHEELQKQLAEGRTVKTPTGSYFLTAGGCMESQDEAFLPSDQGNNHEVRLHLKASKTFLSAIVGDLLVIREEGPDLSSPKIRLVRSAGADGLEPISIRGMVQIEGLRLRFDPKDLHQGIFFMDEGGTATRSPFYPMIHPGMVLASVPESLVPGPYSIEVRAAVNGKDVKTNSYGGLNVVSA